jgi:hypothetical protein
MVVHNEVQVVRGLPWVAELNGGTRRFTERNDHGGDVN